MLTLDPVAGRNGATGTVGGFSAVLMFSVCTLLHDSDFAPVSSIACTRQYHGMPFFSAAGTVKVGLPAAGSAATLYV